MVILGVDPGFDRCGFALIQKAGRSGKIIKTGLIETPKNFSSEKRLWLVADFFKKIIQQYQPDEAAIEKIFFFKNKKTALNISEIVGMLKYIFYQSKIKIFLYTPLQIKQALTGYGRADKKQIYYMLKQLLKSQDIPLQDDAADALAIAMCHIYTTAHSRLITNNYYQ